MPKLNFAKPYYNVAGEANLVATEEAWNVYFELTPSGGFAVRRRPGLTLIEPSISPGTGEGVYWSDRNNLLYFVKDGNVYSKNFWVTPSELVGALPTHNRPAIFAEGQQLDLSSLIYVANGGRLKYIEPATGSLIDPTDANTPSSTFIGMMNNRMFANDISHDQAFLFTDVNPATSLMDTTYWSTAASPQIASAKPDALKGIYTGWNEIYLWGSLACEVWQDDGVSPVSPLVGSIVEAGCSAPYSVVMANNTLIGLASVAGKRAVITIQGRTPQVISEPIANILQSYETVSDAIGSLCFVGGLNVYILTLPTEQVTWAYDFKTDTWSQWGTWDSVNAQQLMFKGRFGAYAKDWNKHITMSENGDLFEFSRTAYDDAGTTMRSSIRTGWIDHGTWDRKRSDQLIIKLKGYTQSPAKLSLRWRSDGFQEWSIPLEIDIQAGGQNDHFCKLNRMGVYRSRQYEFILTDLADLAIVGIEEDVIKLRN
jgi:hypothetical protein